MDSLAERIYFSCPVSVQNILVSVMGYRLYSKRYTGSYRNIRRELADLASRGTSEIKAMQEENLHSMVHYCYSNVPFYERLFVDHGIKPADITNLENLRKIPTLDKRTLREQ